MKIVLNQLKVCSCLDSKAPKLPNDSFFPQNLQLPFCAFYEKCDHCAPVPATNKKVLAIGAYVENTGINVEVEASNDFF